MKRCVLPTRSRSILAVVAGARFPSSAVSVLACALCISACGDSELIDDGGTTGNTETDSTTSSTATATASNSATTDSSTSTTGTTAAETSAETTDPTTTETTGTTDDTDSSGPGVTGSTGTSTGSTGTSTESTGTSTGSESGTTDAETCGDGVIDGTDICDGADVDGQNCAGQGMPDGVLACAQDCSAFDVSGCFDSCGDDVVDTDDVCDGTDLGMETCLGRGFVGGELGCAADCSAIDESSCFVSILTPTDPVIAIDLDGNSAFPVGEIVRYLVDANPATKYLNTGGAGSGFIVTLAEGATAVTSFQLRTADDVPERDPASWEIYGTNDAIQSLNHSDATGGENWTFIAGDEITMPDARLTPGPVISFPNATAYTSYRMVFPTLRADTPLFQLDEAQLFDAAMTPMLSHEEAPSMLATNETAGTSDTARAEIPEFAIDGAAAQKYLNRGDINSGFIVTPGGPNAANPVQSIRITTANDFSERDPATWELYGTDDAITSTQNSDGNAETWTLIDSGAFNNMQVTVARLTTGALVPVSNTTAYASYRLLFPSLRDLAGDMQVGEVEFFGSAP